MICSSSLSMPKQKSYLYLAFSLCDGLEDYNLKQVATLLCVKEADPNILMPLHGITPFHLVIGNDSEAFAEETTKLFLRHGGNPNVKSVDGMTPVHVAAAWGRIHILELLLANGGDPLCLDAENCSPFHYAFQGSHYEAVSILCKYCINVEREDESTKFERQLDKVLVTNGDILAEYIASDESSFKNLRKSTLCNKVNPNSVFTRSFYPHSNCSVDSILIKNDFVTLRKKIIKKLERNSEYMCNTSKGTKYDFKRKTVEEKKDVINEIISQFSSSIKTDLDVNNKFQTYGHECLSNYGTTSPKRKQIVMTFNRPTKYNICSKLSKKHTLNSPRSKNDLTNLKLTKISNNLKKSCANSYKNLFCKTPIQQFWSKKLNSKKFKLVSPVQDIFSQMYFDETIISKSPNLVINTHKNLLKTCNFDKKLLHSKCKISKNLKMKSPNKTKNYQNSTNTLPRYKKCYATAVNINSLWATATNYEKYENENLSFLNNTCKYESSTLLSALSDQKYIHNRNPVYLNNTKVFSDTSMYDDENIFRRNYNTAGNNKSKKTPLNVDECTSDIDKFTAGINIYSNITSDSVNNMPVKTSQKIETELNLAMPDSYSSKNLIKNKRFNGEESQNFDNSNKYKNALDSLSCEKGSIFSDFSDNNSSLNRDEKSQIENEFNNENNIIPKELNSLQSNLIFCKDSLSSYKRIDSDTFISVDEEYKYQDTEKGIAFLERRLCVAPTCISDVDTSYYSCTTAKSEPIPKEMLFLDYITIREKLKKFGENPGPITDTTNKLYLKRLHKLESEKTRPILENMKKKDISNFEKEKELLKPLLLSIDWIKNLNELESLEQKIFSEFATPSPSRKWREGTHKHSFNYLLLDPRITKDLPRRAKHLSLSDQWEIFLSAIFYVGKGKQSRPYAHLYNAFKIWVSQNDPDLNNKKMQKILDIWNEGKGVVVLHVFQNTIPVEAYTREAMMIEVLGTEKLGNCKFGEYYGMVSTWRSKEKCKLGRPSTNGEDSSMVSVS